MALKRVKKLSKSTKIVLKNILDFRQTAFASQSFNRSVMNHTLSCSTLDSNNLLTLRTKVELMFFSLIAGLDFKDCQGDT